MTGERTRTTPRRVSGNTEGSWEADSVEVDGREGKCTARALSPRARPRRRA
jgi:hypothetical protein